MCYDCVSLEPTDELTYDHYNAVLPVGYYFGIHKTKYKKIKMATELISCFELVHLKLTIRMKQCATVNQLSHAHERERTY